MSILENPRANPGLARVIFRHLAAVGGQCDRDKLFSAVSGPGAGWYDPADKGSPHIETVTVGERLGLWTVSKGGVLELALPTAEWGSGSAVAPFRRLVRRRLFRTVGQRNPFEEKGLASFAGALAWLMAQDPLAPLQAWEKSAKGRDAQAVQAADLSHSNRLVTNSIQWDAFVKWASFLGFASSLHFARQKDLIIPDPSTAIHDELALDQDGTSIRQMLDLLSVALPVLDGGSLRRHVEAQWRGDAPPAFVSPALSLALAQLDARKKLELDNVPDARPQDRVVLHMGPAPRTVSTVRLGSSADA